MHPPRTQSIQAFTQAPTTLQREARLNDFVGQARQLFCRAGMCKVWLPKQPARSAEA